MTEETKKQSTWLWPDVTTEAGAKEATNFAAVGGGLMVLGFIVTLVMVYFGASPQLVGWETANQLFVAQIFQIILASLLVWRVLSGHGRFAAIFLLFWILVEVGIKLIGGQLNAGYMIMWFFAIASIFNSVRGSWALHRMRKAEHAMTA